ncbi:MAG: AAA family ATPase [Spirochaetia bacterium]|nr:AAA family ATPase [Spirochaetia bacterium]
MELKAKDLDYSVPIEKIQEYRKTKLESKVIGQPRALKALQFGIGINAKGYNIFVIGASGTGKRSTVRKVLTKYKNRRPLKDVACVCNFSDPDSPNIIYFPKGKGIEFKEAVKSFITLARKKLRIQTENKVFKSEKTEIFNFHETEDNKLRDDFEARLNKDHFELVRPKDDPEQGPELYPVFEGNPVSLDELRDMMNQKKITKKEYESWRTRYYRHMDKFDDVLRKIQINAAALDEKIDELKKKHAAPFIESCLEKIRQEFKDKEVNDYLDDLKKDILEHLDIFFTENPDDSERIKIECGLSRYDVNVLVDNSKTLNCPVIYETHPSYTNLFGSIEYRPEPQGGETKSSYLFVKGGSLLKASGGFLVISADDLTLDESWDYLKRTLKNGELQIQPLPGPYSSIGASIKPQPVKIDLKVILIGDFDTFLKLSSSDVDFGKYFNVLAVFESHMNYNEENTRQFVAFVVELVRKMKYKPITDEGIGYVLMYARRLTEDRKKLSVRFSKITDLICEANYWAKEMGLKEISVQALKKAEDEKRYLVSMYEDHIFEDLGKGILKIKTDGKRIGAINGLTITRDAYEFGQPSLITAVCSAGDEGIISIEHEADLSGEILDKAVLITEGFLRGRYEDNYHMSFRASICFEQMFGVDGDSASAAELYAILSAVTGVPLRQDLAVTGSMNQHGDIQAIGGVSNKITGFYKLCKERGLTGKQGVVVPKDNIDSILLSQEIIDAVAAKKFHIYPISTIDEGNKLFTGMDSDSFNALAKKRFKELSSKVKGNK